MNKMLFFLILFGLVSIFQIAVIIQKKETLRKASKCIVIPLLLAAYIAGGGCKFFLPIPALILGWMGDVLLIKIEKRIYFMLGLASFLLGHVFYIAAFIYILDLFGPDAAGGINIPAILIFTPPAFVLGMVVFRLIKPIKEMRTPVIAYMTTLVTLTLFGFQVFLSNPGNAGLLILSGCLCFMISDTILAYYTFRKLKVSGSALIMSYYLLAQAEIVLGLLLL